MRTVKIQESIPGNFVLYRSAALAIGLSLVATPAFAGYAAIAFSQDTGAYGSSWNYKTRWQAEERALEECEKYGPGCEVVNWTRNACTALATSPDDGYGAAWGVTKFKAEMEALDACYESNDSCSIRVSFCTD